MPQNMELWFYWDLVARKIGLCFMALAMVHFLIPQAALAVENQNLTIFEVKAAPASLTYSKVAEMDPLVRRLSEYLLEKKSPLAPYAADIVKLPQWQQALGITKVESNFCSKAKNFNCGSVGVAPSHPSWRKHSNAFDGFVTLTTLLERPLYKERLTTCAKKRGVYVQPGSASWVRGCEQVQKDMVVLQQQAEDERGQMIVAAQELVNAPSSLQVALAN